MQYATTRVEYTNSNYFQTLAPEDAAQLSTRVLDRPLITVLRRWVYGVGYRPTVQSDITQMSADGSKLVMQMINDAQGNPERVRMILLESDETCEVVRLDTGAGVTLSEGQYVDAVRKSDGNFDHFTEPDTFDTSDPPAGSEGLLTEINTARTPRNIP
jgi:hypothetical protein